MIVSLAVAAALQALNPVTEVVDPDARIVSVQAIVKLPKLGGREQSELALIAETLTADVDGYSRREMRNMAARAGDSVRVTVMPDHVRIQIGVLPADLLPAIGYVDQLVRTSQFADEAVNAAMAEIPFRSKSLWASGLNPAKYMFDRIKHEDLLDLYHRIFRPETVWLSVGGPIRKGEAAQYWANRNADWQPGKKPRATLDTRPLGEVQGISGRENWIELRGAEIPTSDAAMAVRILAMVGLGSGKGSAMFERLRESKGWSYRQEAILWPSVGGFVPRLVMVSGDQTPSGELAGLMKSQLLEAVNAWTDEDATRARGMAEGILLRGFLASPLYFNPSWPVGDSIHDRTFLAAYWPMKTGRDWQPRKLLGEMILTSTQDMKDAALAILNDAETHVIFAKDK